MNFKALVILATLFTGHAVFATDLIIQRQCESLPAVSCKVVDINIETYLSTAPLYSVTAKYCKNRVFKVKSWKINDPKVIGSGIFTSNWCTEAITFQEYGSTVGPTPHALD